MAWMGVFGVLDLAFSSLLIAFLIHDSEMYIWEFGGLF